MRLSTSMLLCSAVVAGSAAYAADKPIKFWNLTAETITELYMAPAGTQKYGPNQCVNDKDGTVETDEMVVINDISPGKYDIKLKDVSGRSCLVKSVTVKAHDNFSIGEAQLKDCKK
jgi:hypothetical protein